VGDQGISGVDQRPSDDQVNIPQPVAQDGDSQCDGEEQPEDVDEYRAGEVGEQARRHWRWLELPPS